MWHTINIHCLFLICTITKERENMVRVWVLSWKLPGQLNCEKHFPKITRTKKPKSAHRWGRGSSPKGERKEIEDWVTGWLWIRTEWSRRKGWGQKFRDHEVGFLLHVWESTGDGQSIWRPLIGPTTHQAMSVPKWNRPRGMAWCRSQLWETHDSIGQPCKVNLPKVLGPIAQHSSCCPHNTRVSVYHGLPY